MKAEKILDQLIEQSEAWDEYKFDYTVPASDIKHNPLNSMTEIEFSQLFVKGAITAHLSDNGLKQLCQKLGGVPVRYMRKCPPELRAINLNHWQQKMSPDKGWTIRVFEDNVRAVLSADYRPVNNTMVLRITRELIEGANLQSVRPYLTPDRLDLRLMIPDPNADDTGNYGIGVYIGNEETGRGSVRITPLIQRHSCTNSIVYFGGGFVQRHIGKAASEASMRVSMKDAIGQSLHVSEELLAKVMQAEEVLLPDIADVVQSLSRENRIPEKTQNEILMGTEGQRNVMGVVNGLSFAAHHAPDVNQDEQVRLERMAGAILADPDDLFGAIARDRKLDLEEARIYATANAS